MSDIRIFMGLLAVLAGLGAPGCASVVPDPIRQAPAQNLTTTEVRANPGRYQGVEVRWGGVVAGIENLADHTLIQVVSRPLSGGGRPRDSDAGYGRFLARVPGFVDPAILAPGRELTVRGRVAGIESRPVGDYHYPYILVDVEAHYLWPLPEPDYDPYFYDPWWYDPWYPHRYPFYPWPR
ncbi:MAG: Slp family lipoprotein [Desulfurivibrio sp.]